MTDPLGCTPSQTVGPFLSIGLLWPDGPDLVPDGTPGAVVISGGLLDGAGDPVPDGMVEIWQADPDGRFAHPDDPRGSARHPALRAFGRCLTDADGRFRFRTLRPGPVPTEDGRMQAPHLDVTVFARGLLRHLVTRMYFPDDAANATDPVLQSLDPADRAALTAQPDDDGLRFDIRLQGSQGSDHQHETPFFAV
jgi:protocatechuate 3,4-dioxygenase alpha subunit